MKTDNDQRSDEELDKEVRKLSKSYLDFLIEGVGEHSISMTDATEWIFGSSGRGSGRAVKIIETLADHGYLKISGSKKRRVEFTDKGRELQESDEFPNANPPL